MASLRTSWVAIGVHIHAVLHNPAKSLSNKCHFAENTNTGPVLVTQHLAVA